MSKILNGLHYTKSHEWVKITENRNALVGITDYAQNALSDVVFVNISVENMSISKGDEIGDIESIKAVSQIYSPLSGKVVKINQEIIDSPETLNEAPYDSWLIELNGEFDTSELMTASEYESFLSEVE